MKGQNLREVFGTIGYYRWRVIREWVRVSPTDRVLDVGCDDDAARARSPLKIVESLAMGVPAITGNVGDRTTMLNHSKAGVLVTPGDAESLAEGKISVLQDRDRRKAMSQEALLLYQRVRWDHLVHEFVKVYEN